MTRKPTDSGAQPPPDAELYHNLPAVTPRQWGAREATDDSFGQPGLGGPAARHRGVDSGGQGEFAQDQGRHAQSGHGRGGSAAEARHDSTVAGGTDGVEASRQAGESTRPDDNLRDDVIGRLAGDDQLEAGEILVMVEDGVVTLTGEVPQAAMKQRAQAAVEGATGARNIVNRITVDNGDASFGPLGQAVRSGHDQKGSGFSSSAEIPGRE